MRIIGVIILAVIIVGCSQQEGGYVFNDMKDFQGFWRDTIYSDGKTYVGDLVIIDNVIDYTLAQSENRIVHDRLSGVMTIGNENKIGWSGISHIDNKVRQTVWTVLDMTTYDMRLYSNLMGEHGFRRVYAPSYDFVVQDTLVEMLQFKNGLPLSKTDLGEMFGTYNKIRGDSIDCYLLSHPLFRSVLFSGNHNNDSVYSYTLNVNDWNACYNAVGAKYAVVRTRTDGLTELCDAESLAKSTSVAIADSINGMLTFSPIGDFDYWPNVSNYLGKTIDDVKRNYSSRYVYILRRVEDDMLEYQYQSRHDGICETIAFASDDIGVIRRCWVKLLEKYSLEQRDIIRHLLESRYGKGVEDGINYIYQSLPASNGISHEVRYETENRTINYISNQ